MNKVKWLEMTYYVNNNQKNTGVNILISEKLDFKTMSIKGKKGDITMIESDWLIERNKYTNGYVPNNRLSK